MKAFGAQPPLCCAHHFSLVIQGFLSTHIHHQYLSHLKPQTPSFFDRRPVVGELWLAMKLTAAQSHHRQTIEEKRMLERQKQRKGTTTLEGAEILSFHLPQA